MRINSHEQNATQVRTQLEKVEAKVATFVKRANAVFVCVLAGSLYASAVIMFFQ